MSLISIWAELDASVRNSLRRGLRSGFTSLHLIGGFDWSHRSDEGLLDGIKAVGLVLKSVGGLIGRISEAWEETEHAGDFETNCKMEIDES